MRKGSRSDVSQGPFLWTRGIAARETLRYLEENGVDAEPLLGEAGLSRGQLSQQRGGISVAAQYRFLELAATAGDDSLFGLHLAAEMDLRSAGILFYLGASSATVSEALENMARYAGTTSEAVVIELSRHKDATVVTMRPVAHGELRRQWSEFIALALIRALRRLTGRGDRLALIIAKMLVFDDAPTAIASSGRGLNPAQPWLTSEFVNRMLRTIHHIVT